MSTEAEEKEFVRVRSLCKMYDCDRKTMERLLPKLQETHEIHTTEWNGQMRVHLKEFRRAVLQRANLTF